MNPANFFGLMVLYDNVSDKFENQVYLNCFRNNMFQVYIYLWPCYEFCKK